MIADYLTGSGLTLIDRNGKEFPDPRKPMPKPSNASWTG